MRDFMCVGPCLSIPRTGTVEQFLLSSALHPVPMGSITPLYGGMSPEAENLNGEYFVPWARVSTPRNNDPALGKGLWTRLEEEVQRRAYPAIIRVKVASLN